MDDGIRLFFEAVILGLEIWFVVWIIQSIKRIKNDFLPDIKMYAIRTNQKIEKNELKSSEITELRTKVAELEKKIEKLNKNTPE